MTFTQPNRQKKCWNCTFLQTTDLLHLCVSYMADMLKVYISLNFDSCDNAVVKIWLGLSTKNTWLELGIDQVLGLGLVSNSDLLSSPVQSLVF